MTSVADYIESIRSSLLRLEQAIDTDAACQPIERIEKDFQLVDMVLDVMANEAVFTKLTKE